MVAFQLSIHLIHCSIDALPFSLLLHAFGKQCRVPVENAAASTSL